LPGVNRNWMTHHLSLVYTPGKALSLAIAAEVFKRVPRGVAFGKLPEAAVFPPFRSSAEADLSELVTAETFLASNTTETPPPKPEALTRVWGCGSSPVVTYDGTGAYFLDRVAAGVWRLQLYPDVFTVADPYTGTAETKVRVLPSRHLMTIRLPDLGAAFAVRPFDGQTAGDRLAKGKNGAFEATPGDYLLTCSRWRPSSATLRAAAAAAPRYAAPHPDADGVPLLRGTAPAQWRAGCPLALQVEAVFATNVTARLIALDGTVHCAVPMTPSNARTYTAAFPGTALTPGPWRVTFRAAGPAGVSDYPDDKNPDARWFPTAAPAVSLLRMPQTADAAGGLVLSRGNFRSVNVSLTDGRMAGTRALRLSVDGFGDKGSAAGYSLPFSAHTATLEATRAGLRLVTHGGENGARFELGFRMKNGQGFGCNLHVGAGWSETVVPASEMIPLWGLPTPSAFRWQEVERVSVLTGPWLWNGGVPDKLSFALAAVEWIKLEPALPLMAADGTTPWSLFDLDAGMRAPDWSHKMRRGRITDEAGHPALHVGVPDFSGEHDSLSLRLACDGKTFANLWQTDGERAVLHIRARAASPHTTGFELALIESDGTPWGTVVPLTTAWQTIRIPVSKLHLFTQWGKEFAAQAGPHLRVSRLTTVNLCFGKWLFPKTANAPHAIEIADIGISAE